ncbi:hypothetical protein MRX96_039261 [Rhipicephalus microplus]
MLDEKKTVLLVQDIIDFFCKYIMGGQDRPHSECAPRVGGLAGRRHQFAPLPRSGAQVLGQPGLRKVRRLERVPKLGEKPPMYPDFMEKQGAKNTYCSRKVLGQLYRNCKKVELITEYLDVIENTLPDPRLLLKGRGAFLKETWTSYRR